MSLSETILNILKALLLFILLPVFFAVFVIFLIIWLLLTITGIGPGLHYLYKKRDDKLLDINEMIKNDSDIQLVSIPPNVHSCAPNGYNVFAIYRKGKENVNKNLPSICIPNGLGATAILISNMQEKLVEQGYNVLNFDRLGVGLSDANTSNKSPSAIDVVNEMYCVMKYIIEKYPTNNDSNDNSKKSTDWILIGP